MGFRPASSARSSGERSLAPTALSIGSFAGGGGAAVTGDDAAMAGSAGVMGVVLGTGRAFGATGSGCGDMAQPASRTRMENDPNNR
jgi:hypothetical protein